MPFIYLEKSLNNLKRNKNNMEKTKNCWVIPTNKPSRLMLGHGILFFFKDDDSIPKGTVKNQNIYITNDKEIKEGDWCLSFYNYKVEVTKEYPIYKMKNGDFYCQDKKIILTTDQNLIKDGVQAIPDDFFDWFVKNPSCEEVEIVKDYSYRNLEHFEYKIIIPKENLGYTTKMGIEVSNEMVRSTMIPKDRFDDALDSFKTSLNKKYDDSVLTLQLTKEESRGLLTCIMRTSAKGKDLDVGEMVEEQLIKFLNI